MLPPTRPMPRPAQPSASGGGLGALSKIGMIMQATGMGLKGQNGASVYDKYYADQEKEKRKSNVQGLLDSMNLSQQKRAFLEMLPFEQSSPLIWDLMNPKPMGGGGGRAPTEAELAQQFVASLGGGSMPQPQQQGGGFSMGVPDDLGSPVAAAGGLSLGSPAVASPAPASTQGLSFGNIQETPPQAPTSPYEVAKRQVSAEMPAILAGIKVGDPKAIARLKQVTGIMKQLEVFAPQVPDLTDDIQEFQYAEENPAFAEYMRGMRKAGATNIETVVGQPGSPGWEAVDKSFADVYMQWMQGGGSDTIKQIAQLEGVLGQLVSGEPITGPAIGLQPQALQTIFNPEALDARQRVEEVVQRNLKAILGAQFTQQEGDRLISRAFDQRLSPEQNARRLNALIEQMKYAAAAKQGMIGHFSQNGTLRGFEGGGYIPTVEDFHAALDKLDREMGVRADALDGFTQEELDWLGSQ